MVKSKGKHVMMEAYPRCFSEARIGGAPAEVQITDALSWLYSNFSEKRSPATGEVTLMFTGGHLFEKAMHLVVNPLQQEGAVAHVVLFDKSEFTPITKNARLPAECYARTARDRSLESGGAALSAVRADTAARKRACPPGGREAFVREEDPLPAPWVSVMEDRAEMRRWVVGDVVHCLLDRSSEHHVRHGAMGDMAGKRAVFDGHCLVWGDVYALEGFVGLERFETDPEGNERRVFRADEPLADAEAARTPLAVEYAGAYERRVYFAPRFRNELGESDFSAFWYARDPAGLGAAVESPRVQVNACDVDLMYLAMAFDAKHRESGASPRLSIRMGFPSTSPHRRFPSEGNHAKKESYVDVGALCACAVKTAGLENRTGPSPLLSAALSFAGGMVAAGSDYTEGFEGISQASFFAAMKNHAGYIGALVSAGPCWGRGVGVDGRAFFRMVKAAYCERYAGSRVAFKNFTFSSMSTREVRKMVAITNAKFPEKQLPGVKSLLGRLGNLWYYAIMMSQVGEPRLRLPAGEELRLYGYGNALRAPDMVPLPGPIEKWNIRRTCNDEIIGIRVKKARAADAKRAAPCPFPDRLPGEDI